MAVSLHFSGGSDGLLCLSVGTDARHTPDDVIRLDDGTDSHQLDEISALHFRGWWIAPEDHPPFAVYAILGPVGSMWCFAIGFPPNADTDTGADIGQVQAITRQDPDTPYSTELVIQLGGRCMVEAIPGPAVGAA